METFKNIIKSYRQKLSDVATEIYKVFKSCICFNSDRTLTFPINYLG